MKKNDMIQNFLVQSVNDVPELHGTLYKMEYIKNGAQLIWLDNKEDNKWFSITFKTLPTDDTGVFHILEHSVLNGSRKYPVKEPFVELQKSSMSTFLNAMTFSDKTMFPISSRNRTDFLNLMEVYLDAVFFPRIYENPNIFYQEGWHYELSDVHDEPEYNGVVYNEMKGAFSSIDTLMENGLQQLFFPDNCYQYVSGGNPKYIPNLTYEQFIATHRKYYHPSNAKIYLEGDIPIEKVLQILDEDYLSKFERQKERFDIMYQKPVSHQSQIDYYEISKDEQMKNKAHMALGKVLCDYNDRQTIMALWVLSSYLTGSQDAPLTKAILENHLGQDISFYVTDNILQPYYSIRIFNTDYEKREDIKKIIKKTINDVIDQGFDHVELEAILNQIEFELKNIDEPQALTRNVNVLGSWLYDGDPKLYLENNHFIEILRKNIKTHYYEDLLASLVLDNDLVEFYLCPSYTKGDEDRQDEMEVLRQLKASWSNQEIINVIALNKDLKTWQETPDHLEDLKSLPNLSLSEIDSKFYQLKTEVKDINHIPILFHLVEEDNVVHFHYYYSLSDCSIDQLQCLSFLTNIFGMLPTQKHSVSELQCLIRQNIGFLDYNIKVYSVPKQSQQCKPYFVITCSVLKDHLKEAIDIIMEIIQETDFENEISCYMIKNILVQCYESMRQGLMNEGHQFAMGRALSHFSATGYVQEHVTGYAFYNWLKDLVEHFDKQKDSLIKNMMEIQKRCFQNHRLTISITSSKIPEEFLKMQAIQNRVNEEMKIELKETYLKEAIVIPTSVSYSSLGGCLSIFQEKYSGVIKVLATILSYGVLWNEVRVKGGAYGCGFVTGVSENLVFYSYRDPSPLHSQDVYSQVYEYINEFCQSDEDIDKYIISTLAKISPLQSLKEQSESVDMDYLSGITYKERQAIYQEILNMKKEDLLKYCSLFKKLSKQGARCIIGAEDVIQQCSNDWKVYTL